MYTAPKKINYVFDVLIKNFQEFFHAFFFLAYNFGYALKFCCNMPTLGPRRKRGSILLRTLQPKISTPISKQTAKKKVAITPPSRTSSKTPPTETKQYFEVIFAKGIKKSAKTSEGYFAFSSSKKSSLHTMNGKKLAEEFFVSNLENKDKRVKSISIGDEFLISHWKIEPMEEISAEEFERIIKMARPNNVKNQNKTLQNLKPVDENNIGHRLLTAMGWKEGSGLGKQQDGQVEPLGLFIRNAKTGLGYG